MALRFIRILGQGGFYYVYLAEKADGKLVAVKTPKLPNNTKQPKRTERQVKLGERTDHRNIISSYGVEGKFGLVYKYYAGGDASQYLQGKDINFPGRWGIVVDVGRGLSYLHGLNIVHGDLKPSNVLIDCGGRAVISDFDRAAIITEGGFTTTNQACSHRYASPEMLGLGDLEEKSPIRVTKPMDIYSFMMTVLELLTGLPPFYQIDHFARIIMMIGHKKRPLRVDYPALHDDVWSLLESGWAHSPGIRPEVGVIVTRLERLKYGGSRQGISPNITPS